MNVRNKMAPKFPIGYRLAFLLMRGREVTWLSAVFQNFVEVLLGT